MITPAVYAKDGTPTRTGIVLQAVPTGGAEFGVEVQRTAPTTDGAPNEAAALSVALWDHVPSLGQVYLDPLPLDGALRYYRGRGIGSGYGESAWTAWTTGHTPVVVPKGALEQRLPDGVVPQVAGFGYTVTADAASVTYTLTFGAYCETIEVYSIAHASSGGANPPLTIPYRAARLSLPVSGTVIQRIATTANYYRRTRLLAYNAAGVLGQDSPVIETQAVASGAPPSAAPNTLAKVGGTTATLDISWVNGDATAETRIYVDGAVVYTAAAAATTYTIPGLAAGTTYQVDADHFKNGQASAKVGAVSMATDGVTLDAPTSFAATGVVAPVYMTFAWNMGTNAAGAVTVIQESAIGDFSDAAVIVTTGAGATSATSAAHAAGTYSFRAKHQLAGSSDSAWSNVAVADYGGA